MLISQKWNNFVEDNKLKILMISEEREDLYEYLKNLDMFNFVFEIEEGHRESDSGLENFPRYKLSFVVGATEVRISVNVGPDFMPNVKYVDVYNKPLIDGMTVQFPDFFKISKSESYDLDKFFTEFADSILKRH